MANSMSVSAQVPDGRRVQLAADRLQEIYARLLSIRERAGDAADRLLGEPADEEAGADKPASKSIRGELDHLNDVIDALVEEEHRLHREITRLEEV